MKVNKYIYKLYAALTIVVMTAGSCRSTKSITETSVQTTSESSTFDSIVDKDTIITIGKSIAKAVISLKTDSNDTEQSPFNAHEVQSGQAKLSYYILHDTIFIKCLCDDTLLKINKYWHLQIKNIKESRDSISTKEVIVEKIRFKTPFYYWILLGAAAVISFIIGNRISKLF